MKGSGTIGFWMQDAQVKPGVYKSKIVEKLYTWDVNRNMYMYQTAENQQNDNMRLNDQLSIIGDTFMQNNWASIKYVNWKGVKWKVTSIDVSPYPRIRIELGGVFNGPTSTT